MHDVDWSNRESVIAFAREMARKYPKYRQLVYKHPDRPNYNVTMQPAQTRGAVIVWDSAAQN
jgi:hypothetical protein